MNKTSNRGLNWQRKQFCDFFALFKDKTVNTLKFIIPTLHSTYFQLRKISDCKKNLKVQTIDTKFFTLYFRGIFIFSFAKKFRNYNLTKYFSICISVGYLFFYLRKKFKIKLTKRYCHDEFYYDHFISCYLKLSYTVNAN